MDDPELTCLDYDNDTTDSEDIEDIEARLYSQIHYACDENTKDVESTNSTKHAHEIDGEVWEQVTAPYVGSVKTKPQSTSNKCTSESASKKKCSKTWIGSSVLKKNISSDVIILDSDNDNKRANASLDSVVTISSNTESSSNLQLLEEESIKIISESDIIDLDSYYSSSGSSDVDLDDYYTSSDSYSDSGPSSDGEEGNHAILISSADSSEDDTESDALDLANTDVGNDLQLNVDIPADRNTGLLEDLQKIHDNLAECDWSVDYRDRTAVGEGTSIGKRYYSIINVTCSNCNTKGHLSKVCPKPKKAIVCILCSVKGHHWKVCPDGLCHNCYAPGHLSRECDRPRRSRHFTCNRCQRKGHGYKECPDIWRQYHITTQMGQICRGNTLKHPRDIVTCYNCGKNGHYGHECEEERMTHHGIPLLPFIAHYDTPKMQRSRKNKRQKEETGKPSKGKKKESKKHKEKRDAENRTEEIKIKKKQKGGNSKTCADEEHPKKSKQKSKRKEKEEKRLRKNDSKERDYLENATDRPRKKLKFSALPWMESFASTELAHATEEVMGKKHEKKKKRKYDQQERDESPQPNKCKKAKRKRAEEIIDLTQGCNPGPSQTCSTKTSRKHAMSATWHSKERQKNSVHSEVKRQPLWTTDVGCTFQANSSLQDDVFQKTFLAGYEDLFD